MIVQKKHLQAALLFAATKDVRYYLNGVLFDKSGYIVATDGHRAIAIDAIKETCAWLESFIVPSELIQKALKVSDKNVDAVELEIDFSQTSRDYTVSLDGIKGICIDGRYPEWQAVIPHKANPKDYVQSPAILNPEYHMDAVKAHKIMLELGKNAVCAFPFKTLRPKGLDDLPWNDACALLNNQCCVYFGDGFTFVVMPTRA